MGYNQLGRKSAGRAQTDVKRKKEEKGKTAAHGWYCQGYKERRGLGKWVAWCCDTIRCL